VVGAATRAITKHHCDADLSRSFTAGATTRLEGVS
jgi:hypothetical protein